MEVICLEEEAFYALVKKVVTQIKEEHNVKEDKWIRAEEAMQILGITSRTTLQKLRDEGKIRFSPIMQKVILYDRDSLYEFIESKAQDTF